MILEEIEREIDAVLTRAIDAQRRRVLALGRAIDPHVTPEDLQNPQDLPPIVGDPRWNYEDGILAGWLSAQMAVRAHLRDKR